MKFGIALGTYNSVEVLQNKNFLEEWNYFTPSIGSDIIVMILFVSLTAITIYIYIQMITN